MSSNLIFIFRLKNRITEQLIEQFDSPENLAKDTLFIQFPLDNISFDAAEIFAIHEGDSYESLKLNDLVIAEFDTESKFSVNPMVISLDFNIEDLDQAGVLELLQEARKNFQDLLN
jgi:hypothetical protein